MAEFVCRISGKGKKLRVNRGKAEIMERVKGIEPSS